MIGLNEFDSDWWGKPVGIVTDPAFFGLPSDEREDRLTQYVWVEFRVPLNSGLMSLWELHRAGFTQIDTQINYRLGFRGLMKPPSLDELDVEFADESPFTFIADDVKSFDHERFIFLPGISQERINQRYALWGATHINEHPSTCLRVLYKGSVAGWYLGDDIENKGLHLALGMLHKDSEISGLLFFLKAYHAFASRGHRLGWASFSVHNTPVHNIYSGIGARFLDSVGYWMWIRQDFHG